jgi:hypothetical protein
MTFRELKEVLDNLPEEDLDKEVSVWCELRDQLRSITCDEKLSNNEEALLKWFYSSIEEAPKYIFWEV